MRSPFLISSVLFLIVALVPNIGVVSASDDSFAIRAGRIITVSPDLPAEIVDGVIIVRSGRIDSIGAAHEIPIPRGMRIVDLPDATIMPGLVAASSSLAGSHRGNESIAAGYRAIDAFDRYASYQTALEAGVTTAHVNPGRHRLMTGQGAVIRLAGDADHRVLREASDLTINLGDAAFNPPMLRTLLVPPASDQAIEPDRPQRAASRISQFLALKETIESALSTSESPDDFDAHRMALRQAWQANMPLRIHADRGHDLTGAIAFMNSHQRHGYVVGGAQAAQVVDRIAEAGIPLVYTISSSFRQPGDDIGVDPTAIEPDVRHLVNLGVLELALCVDAGQPLGDLRLAAGLALRAGLDEHRIIGALTAVPARILGVDDRVGSLSPGKDADLLVLSGRPLETSSHVQRVYVRGELVHRVSNRSSAMIVRAGTIWLGPDSYLHDGSVLIEEGRIVEVGKRVSHPPHARVIDAGRDAFVTPGLIDARGHLGLRGDRSAAAPQISLARLIGLPDEPEDRVARAGVTTVLMHPYNLAGGGSQISAVRTGGQSRQERVIRPTVGVALDLSGNDPAAIPGQLRQRLGAARRYLNSWKEYEEKLAEWEKKQAEGETVTATPEVVEERIEQRDTDPMSGIWSATVSGGPIPEPANARLMIRMTGTSFEGQIIEPPAATEVEHRIIGTLEGNKVSGRIEVDTGGMGTPTFEGTLANESISGTISLAGLSVDIEASRVERTVDASMVTRTRRLRDAEGRPVPPAVDESLEPLRAVLEKQIPLVIDVRTASQIKAVLDTLTGDNDVRLVFVNADEAAVHAEALQERGIGIILSPQVMRRVNRQWYHAGDDMARRGVPFAFQSAAEDGARTLPQVGTYAVERGLSAERALAAMTIDAAKMFHLDDRIGSIAPGRDADLVIFSGHPFEVGSTVKRILIHGRDVQP